MQQYAEWHCRHASNEAHTNSSVGRLLVTGGTGFIGGAVLAELVATPLWRNTLILVRADNEAAGHARICASLRRFCPDVDVEGVVRPEQILLGSLEDLGRSHRDARLAEVTHVIHSAAVTAFSQAPKIHATNVDAGLGFLDRLADVAPLQRFLNVGSAWCVGMGESRVIPEDARLNYGNHLVPYTRSKLDFEHRARAAHPDLAFVSARPSIVVGHTRLGTQPSGSIYWVFRAAHILRRFTCAASDRVDVVPVDWTANALVTLAVKPVLAHDAYHLSAGLQSASSILDLDAAISRGLGIETEGMADYSHVSHKALSSAVLQNRAQFGDVSPRLLARALGLYGAFAENGLVFDNARTLSEGIVAPPPFHTYADICAETAQPSTISEQMHEDFKS